MADFKKDGYSYELIIKPRVRGKKRKIEVIKWKTGYKNLWQRISYSEYLALTNSVGQIGR